MTLLLFKPTKKSCDNGTKRTLKNKLRELVYPVQKLQSPHTRYHAR
ncbi:hypothetical protein SBF1_2470014 [Candidatus Desulfosporosinus infrequens]|uniref:Uncharacterized protein n=1 Tax=Candidatus Desulfosporosinus infrequens TaxID=2043169 RepID=A0A2U3KNM3_9FIRM|nr:hypothetical protein SBF1_2470014 [Candidatus Desulfosporosinus infrequens]